MASFNLTAEDCSPLILYSPPGAWFDSPSNDTFLSSYSGSSFHSTQPNTSGANATITFNGTGITFVGGHRPNYGTYLITVDGQIVANNLSSAGPDIFQQVLGSAYDLSNGQHTAVLTSTSDSPIDIDVVYIQTEIGEPGSQLSHSMIDDSDSSFVYSPQSEWSVNEKDYFISDTLHYTSTAGASASITFSGDAFALYGTVAQDHANVVLSIDGKNVTFGAGATPSSAVSTLRTKVLLYYAQGLGSDEHTLIVSGANQSSTAPYIDIDAIAVYSTSGSNTGSSSSQSSASSPLSRPTQASYSDSTFSGKLPKSTIIGVVLGTVFGLLLLSAIVGLLLRWRYRQRQTGSQSPESRSPSMLEAGNKGPAVQRLSQNSISSFYIGPAPGRLSTGSIDSFSSSAAINASNAVQPVPVSQTIPTRPNQRPPPL